MSIKRKVIIATALLVLAGAAGYLIHHHLQGIAEEGDFEDLRKTKLQKLKEKNPDLVGWLKMPKTKINYPVMQTKKRPGYYLRRNFKKKYAISGVPFLDAGSDIRKPTANWLIYGHNMNNGTMFHDLLNYADMNFYQTHKTFRFATIAKDGKVEKATYAVVAAFRSQIYPTTAKAFKYYTYANMTSKTDFQTYIKNIKAIALYNTHITPNYGDQLLTLSTCSYHVSGKQGRFAVVGRRVGK